MGVCELYSRINHSCTPTVHNSYNASIHQEVVHATGSIAMGEGFLTSYIPNVRARSQRQSQLQQYRFTCTCTTCVGPDRTHHEKNRRRLFNLDQTFALCSHAETAFASFLRKKPSLRGHRNKALATEYIRLLEEEGLVGMDMAMG